MAAVQRVLIQEKLLLQSERDDFHWSDAVPAPEKFGEQTEQQFFGRAAAVIESAAIVEQTHAILSDPLPGFLQRLDRVQTCIREALQFARDNSTLLTIRICNGDLTRRAGIAYGAEPKTMPALDLAKANAALLNAETAADELDAMFASLAPRIPAVVDAGFYAAGATGAVGQFALLLSERNMTSEGIAQALGKVRDVSSFVHHDTWRRFRKAALDDAKHLVNRAKAKLFQADSSSGTQAVPGGVPLEAFTCVVVRKHVGTGQPISICLGGRTDLPSPSGHGSTLAQNAASTEPAPGTQAPYPT